MPNWFKSGEETPHWAHILGISPRKAAVVIIAAILLILAGYFGRPYYHAWELRRLTAQARVFFEKKDYRSAVLTARQVLRLNPSSLLATRIMAEAAETAGSPAAVIWHGRVAELEPGRTTNYLAWASSALRRNDWLAAEQALSKINAEGRKTLEFAQAAASLAMGQGQYGAAEIHLSEILKHDPTNLVNQLNLASIRLRSNDPKAVQEAVARLEQLKSHPEFRAAALRSLVADALRGKDNARKLALTEELLATPGITLSDQILRLDALYATRSSQVDDRLEQLLEQTGKDVAGLYALLAWMNVHDRASQALSTALALSDQIRVEQPIPLAIAEAYMTLQDWKGLDALTSKGDWREMDFVRVGLDARALREQGRVLESRAEWQKAVVKTRNSGIALGLLVRLATTWHWDPEAEELWWSLADHHITERKALLELHHIYSTAGKTRSLYHVSIRLQELDRQDVAAINNVAALGLLLKDNTQMATRLALENYQRSTNNPVFVSTYAFALFQQKRATAAAQLMEALPEKYLSSPEIAAYYGIILAANRDRDRAGKYLDLAAHAKLLPEELELVKEARASLVRP